MTTTQDWTEYSGATTAQTVAYTSVTFEVGNATYTDYYATVNAAARLMHRQVTTFANAGNTKVTTTTNYTYESAGASTYTPEQVTTPFTLAEADSAKAYQFPNALPIADLYATAGV